MQEFIEPVTDRTQADVDRVKYLTGQYRNGQITEDEKEEWETDLKGALNRSDLLRVGNNIVIVLGELGYETLIRTFPDDDLFPGSSLLPGTVTWDGEASSPLIQVPELPNESYYEFILRSLRKVYQKGYIYILDGKIVPQKPLNSFIKWNTIEDILKQIHNGTMINSNDVQYTDGTYYANNALI